MQKSIIKEILKQFQNNERNIAKIALDLNIDRKLVYYYIKRLINEK